MKLGKSVAVVMLASGLAACQNGGSGGFSSPLGGTGATVGTLGGAAAGGLLGSQFGGGTGKALAAVAGTLAGGYLGHQFGQRFDQNDQTQAAAAEHEALSSNQRQTWSNPQNGTGGQVTPLRSFTDSAGRECREYSHTVDIQGQRQTGTGVACRQPDGTWQLVGT